MTYDHWKTTNPEDQWMGHEPETIVNCPTCGGEGGYEKRIWVYEVGCGYGHDSSDWQICPTCNGVGFEMEPVEPDGRWCSRCGGDSINCPECEGTGK